MIGDAVEINLQGDTTARPLYKYDGTVQFIAKRRFIKKLHGYVYEMENCQSDKGVPYTFVDEWFK